jgi:hypothetical protein
MTYDIVETCSTLHTYLLVSTVMSLVTRDSSVGIATLYGLDGPGIESRFRPALGSTQSPIQRVPGLFPGGKAAGAWR